MIYYDSRNQNNSSFVKQKNILSSRTEPFESSFFFLGLEGFDRRHCCRLVLSLLPSLTSSATDQHTVTPCNMLQDTTLPHAKGAPHPFPFCPNPVSPGNSKYNCYPSAIVIGDSIVFKLEYCIF